MSTDASESDMAVDAAVPDLRPRRRVGLIWLVPIVAAMIGIVLAVKVISEKGPTITIDFASAEGLAAGKTKIKYKDVEVGRLESIQLVEDLSRVKITAGMVPEIAPYLTEDTRFWIVRARVTAGEVTGLGTLFSGAYIAMDPGKKGDSQRQFVGLEKPPVVKMDSAGSYFNLRAEKLGSLTPGSPVYYRQIKVGQVVRYQLQEKGGAIDIRVFIGAPHDERVNQNTRFWNASGLDFTMDTSGVRIKTESILTLLEGGIAFETPANQVDGGPVDNDRHVFILYDNYDQIDEPVYTRRVYFVAYFDETVRGLNIGAPVEFRGIKIGEVVDVNLEFNMRDVTFRIPVLCYIEPERIKVTNENAASETEVLSDLVQKGMRAQLRTGVLLTGQLYINLSIYPDAKPEKLRYVSGYPQLPTVPEPVTEITTSLMNILERLEKLPIEKIGADLSATVRNANRLMGSEDLLAAVGALRTSLDQLQQFTAELNRSIGPGFSDVIEQARLAMQSGQKALSAAEGMLSADSPVGDQLNETLREMAKAARAISALADLLERNPQALIYGKGADE
jgi:paraquat-inducible protein B